jgi:tetratricopeptide (TPR) repeat protein
MHDHIGALLQTLGVHAQAQRHLPEAARYYTRLAEHVAQTRGEGEPLAGAYHRLGMIAHKQRDFPTAEDWYRKSLAIFEKQGDEHGAAKTYHQLGMVAEGQRDFPTAEAWYRKSLAIKEKQGNEHGAAQSYGVLGLLAGQEGRLVEAARWFIRSIRGFMRTQDERSTQAIRWVLLDCYQRAPDNDQQAILALWDQTGLGPFPEIPGD